MSSCCLECVISHDVSMVSANNFMQCNPSFTNTTDNPHRLKNTVILKRGGLGARNRLNSMQTALLKAVVVSPFGGLSEEALLQIVSWKRRRGGHQRQQQYQEQAGNNPVLKS